MTRLYLRIALFVTATTTFGIPGLAQVTTCYSGTITQFRVLPGAPFVAPFGVGDRWAYSVTVDPTKFNNNPGPNSRLYSPLVSVVFQAGAGTWALGAPNAGNFIVSTATATSNFSALYTSASVGRNSSPVYSNGLDIQISLTFSPSQFSSFVLPLPDGFPPISAATSASMSNLGPQFGIQFVGSFSGSVTGNDCTLTPLLQVTTTSIPSPTAGQPYSTALTATGGTGAGYTWSLSAGSSLPPGFSLSATGVLSSTGSPAAPLQSFGFTVQVTDSSNQMATQQLSLAVLPNPASQKDLGACHVGSCTVGNPVDVGSGNKYEQITDYATVGSNQLSFTRYYNSLSIGSNTFASTLGSNWRSTFDRYARIGPSSIAIERADGQELLFTQNAGAWVSDTDVDIKLVQSGSTYTVTDTNDTVETYTTTYAGQAVLNSIRFRNGYTQTLQYNSSQQLTSVTDSFNRTLSFTYFNGLLQTLTTPDGLVMTYGHTSSGVTPGVLDRLSSVAYSTTPQTSQIYLYENPAVPFAITALIDEDGNRFASWTYDLQGRGLSSQHGSGADLTTIVYNDTDGSRTVTNALGQQAVYHFASLQGVAKVTEIDRLATSTTTAAKQLFTYDSNGYLASQTDWNGNLTTYVNDSHGQPLTTTEASGTPQARTTTVTYHPSFHLPTQIVEPGLTTDLTYDARGNLLTKSLTDTTTSTTPYSTNGMKRVWTYTWSNGLLTSAKGPRTDISELTSYSYDTSGTLIQTANALNLITRVTQHSPGGLPITVVDANGVTTTLSYDARLRLITSTVGTSAGPLTTTNQYDAAGNMLSVTLPDGSATTNTYDAAHRLTLIKDLFNQSTAYTLDALGDRTQTNVLDANSTVKRMHSGTFDALGRMLQDIGGANQTTKYAYDANGNALTITDPLLRVTQRIFDPLNRLTQTTDPANGMTTTAYDAHDRPLSVTAPNGALTTYVYDGFGDLIQKMSPDSGITVYHYDLAGNLSQKNDAAGNVSNYSYDALDRVLSTTYPLDAAENVTYTYDQSGHGFGVGRLTSLTDAIGTLSRSYDERGNLLNETRIISGVTLQTSYTFDAGSGVASINYPSGLLVTYGRDAMGRTTSITAKKPGTSSAVPLLSNIAYMPFGPANAATFGNGIADTRIFDLDYRLTNLTDAGPSPVQNLAYGYDAANNVSSIADAVRSANSQTLGYDALNRLTSATGIYGSIGYTYDSVGNRLAQQLGSTLTTYTYSAQSNRLTSIKSGATTQAVSYTPAGNITTFTNVPSTRPGTGLAYNQANRLSKVLSGGAQTALYTYDAFGQRLVKAGSTTGTTLFQYDAGGHLLAEADGAGHAQVDYVYLGDQTIATFTLPVSSLAFVHNDRLGTPQVATDSMQSVVWRADYQPFGSLNTATSQTGNLRQNLRFPGQENDADTGWYHNGFRDYVPTLGRYLQSDPLGLEGGPNLFLYSNANPNRWYDLLGLQAASLPPSPWYSHLWGAFQGAHFLHKVCVDLGFATDVVHGYDSVYNVPPEPRFGEPDYEMREAEWLQKYGSASGVQAAQTVVGRTNPLDLASPIP